ncbi:MAG TPA: phosphoribosylformylglycinamidine synthase subunit PurQ [Myxococcales bacterium]
MSAPVPTTTLPVRALVVTGFGINCEEEMAAGFRLAGAEATIAHLNELFLGRVSLGDFRILALPGGFSFGDDLGSGKVLANKLRFKKGAAGAPLFDAIRDFLKGGGHVLGVCNGFQALVKLGLLPNVGGNFEQEVTLARNDSGRFEDRWCEVRVNGASRSPVLKGLERLRLPVRHGEGKLVVRDEAIRKAITRRALSGMAYCDEQGEPTQRYPENPNGAELACAALSDPSGQVFGLMPHPEAALTLYNDPAWPQLKRSGVKSEEGQGLALFRNLVTHVGEGGQR